MNRYEVLRTILKGEVFNPNGPSDTAWLKWATTHNPLISPSIYALNGRHLNHFCVGSDPEFAFVDATGERVEAYQLGMKVGLAAGCDQNERLVELRPWPSVSVVTHVAGILTCLRWLDNVYGYQIRNLGWRAGAFFAGDGMGGHVHFGRKRPTRDEEVIALDGLASVLKATGLFPVGEWDQRIRGDRRNQHYGLPGDMRPQRHGYEYRSLPSWLQSPTVAFIILAASKLAVLDPSITSTWRAKAWTQRTAGDALRGLAKLYRGRDDDAYILYHLLTCVGDQVFLVTHAANFAPNWGIDQQLPVLSDRRHLILPACIEPHPNEIKEIEDHLVHGTTLTFTEYPPNFVQKLPDKSYSWVPAHVQPGRHAGFGDLIHDLVTNSAFPVIWEYNNMNVFVVSGFVPTVWTNKEKKLLKDLYDVTVKPGDLTCYETRITVPKALCTTTAIGAFKDTLLKSGLFPIWTVESVKMDSVKEWYATRPKAKATSTWRNV